MNKFDLLVKSFLKLPGVGPRQAKRFAYVLVKDGAFLAKEFEKILAGIDKEITTCSICGSFSVNNTSVCENCSSPKNNRILAFVSSQEDYESLTQNESFMGNIVIVPFPAKIELTENWQHILEKGYIPKTIHYWQEKGLEEILLAFPLTPEGKIMESITIDFLEDLLKSKVLQPNIQVSSLGLGMSLGSRMAETDNETIKFALESRKRVR